ncbi:unnamed protein product [Symbiodinium sp. CCMP2592]|nr:unnamed protein product [Symbiodinium sp. CCMP2592]
MEQHLHERVRCSNACWLSGSDLFQVFGKAAWWSFVGRHFGTLSGDRASAKKDEGIIETIESGSDE